MNQRASDPSAAQAQETDADEREFEAFAEGQDPLDIEAATWALRRRNGLDAAGAAELADWLAADPRHAEALEDMEDSFGELQQLPPAEIAALKAGLAGPQHQRLPAAPGRPAAQPASRARDWFWQGWLPQAALATSLFLLCGAAWLGWQHWLRQPLFEQAYVTARGQGLDVVLPDAPQQGSRLQLDTGTRAAVSLYRDRREVHLEDGQAMFQVHADPQRPFHVLAGSLRITVVGTRFSLRHTPSGRNAGQTVVEVEEGRVKVEPAGPHARDAEVLLHAGQRVQADARGRLGTVGTIAPAAVAAWRSGRLSFDNTPLAQAIAEFERYGHTGLIVRDPAVGALEVGGSYGMDQARLFASVLPQILPVRLVQRGALTEVVAR